MIDRFDRNVIFTTKAGLRLRCFLSAGFSEGYGR
jgi:hypothetical protein